MTPELVFYSFAALFILVFGVLMAMYRFHMLEIAKAQHSKVGFVRVKIAAEKYRAEGYKSEVRHVLTDNAFSYETKKTEPVPSPLPGHPGSDFSAFLASELLKAYKKSKEATSDSSDRHPQKDGN